VGRKVSKPRLGIALDVLFLVLGLAGLAVVLAWMLGCAIGRNELTGEVVFGIGLGRLIETANQALGGIADWGLAAMGIGGSGLGGGLVVAIRKAIHYKSEAATIDAAVAKAKHEGENAGWDSAMAHAAGSGVRLPVVPSGQAPTP
jgi:hypothetical protein